MLECLFCKIANKEIGAEIIYEDEEVVAFLDIHPIAPGHAVVIPKVHAENILGLPNEKIEGLFLAVKKTTSMLNVSLKPEGFTIGINHGKVSGQAIDHIHIHVVPRWKDDGGGSIHTVVNNASTESVKEIANKIRNNKI